MMNLHQFADTLSRLKEMLDEYQRQRPLADLLQDAVKESLLQRFEYTIEIGWKTTKRYLVEIEGYDRAMGPRTVLRLAGRLELLDTADWLSYLQARQMIAHDYSGEKADDALKMVPDFYQAALNLYQRLEAALQAREDD